MADPVDDTIPAQAVAFLETVTQADSRNRAESMEDWRFLSGDQWPAELQSSRQLEARPMLTINETSSYVRQIVNNIRQQRPRIKVHPVGTGADVQVAEVISGLVRHIEMNSDADHAYDTAAEHAVATGLGYWRIITDYTRDDSFDQDIYLRPIDNPWSVYFDPHSKAPDGSDAEAVLISDMVEKSAFKRLYPGAQESGFTQRGSGDISPEWETADAVRIAEYFKVDKIRSKLVMLSDGTAAWERDLPPAALLAQAGVTVKGDRMSWRRRVNWYKVSSSEVLAEREWPGRWIPIVPVYGITMTIDGKRIRKGAVRDAKDPARMVNFWQTSITEAIALAPKAKWVMAEGQDEGHENEWAQANVKALAVLKYKQTDAEGREAPPPSRQNPEPPPAGVIEAALGASQNLQRVMGIFDPAMGAPSGPKSGKAIRAEQGQSDQSNFHYYDNLSRSIRHTGRIILDLIPEIFDTHRTIRIIGDDGEPDMVGINEPAIREGVHKVLNDVTVGDYDVVMDTGPGFNTKRLEAVDAMMPMIQANKEMLDKVGDLVFRQMDFPGADAIADRLAATNPLAQIDEKSEVPPAVQMQLKQAQQQVQQLQQALQAAQMEQKYKMGVVQAQEQAETQREHMRQMVKAHDIENVTRTRQHDTEMRALTAQNVAEIRAAAQLLLSHMDGAEAELDRTEARADRELAAKAAQKEGPTE